jgi:hypothetical protein
VRSGSVRELVGSLRDVLGRLAGTDVTGLVDEEVHAALPELLAAVHQLGAVTSAVVGSFDARGLAERDGFRATRTWLVAYGRMSQGAASGWLERARLLRQLPALAAAAGEGLVSAEQIGRIGQLAGAVGAGEVARFDAVLAELAAAAGPAEVAHACERIHAHLDPDGAEPDPAEAFERREFTLARSGATTYLRGRLDPEGAAAVQTVLDALMRPPTAEDLRTPAQRRADALVEAFRLLLGQGELPTVAGIRPQVGVLLTPAMLCYGRDRLATEAARTDPPGGGPDTDPPGTEQDTEAQDTEAQGTEAQDTETQGTEHPGTAQQDSGKRCIEEHNGGPGAGPPRPARQPQPPHPARQPQPPHPARQPEPPPPQRPRDEAGLDPLERLGVAQLPEPPWLNWVGQIPPELAQRLACDCEIWRAVLDPGTGLPLEVGRTQRLVPHWIRKALHARDRGCRWPGCTAPAAWTDGHHLIAWWNGGPTDIDNLLLLCRHHHVKVHEGHWRLELDQSTGEVRIYRPDGTPYDLAPSRAWISPNRQTHGPPGGT